MGDNILKLTTAIDLKGMEKGFDAIKKGTVSTAKAVNKILNTISGTIKKLVSIYLLKNVFDKLKNYLDSSIRKNREFAASMKNLRGSMAAAFQPIYETIAPGLIYLVQVLNYAVQAVGRFIAAISGKSYAQMLKNAQALSKQKDALDGVGGAAADAQRQLMGFDEINKLSPPGPGTGMAFNELDLGSLGGAIDDFAKRLRDLILSGQFQQAGDLVANAANQIISSLDLSAIATRTAGWINNLTEFSNALGFGINWDELGKKFADGVSTFLGTLNGYNLGRTISLKFAIAIKVLAGFIKNLKWNTVGIALGDALLGFAEGLGTTISDNLDSEFWETLNTNIEDGFTAFTPRFLESLRIAVDTIAEQAPGVMQTIGNIGSQLVTLINDVFSVMDEDVVIGKLDEYDDRGFQLNKIGSRWEMLGNSLAEGFKRIDWGTILTGSIEAAGNLALGLVKFIGAAIEGITSEQWYEVGTSIGEGIKNIPWVEIFTGGLKICLGLANAIFSGLSGLISSFTSEDLQGFIDSIGNTLKDLPWEDTIIEAVKLAKISGEFYVKLVAAIFDAATGENASEIVTQSVDNNAVVDAFKEKGVSEAEAWVQAYQSGQLQVLEDVDGTLIGDAWNNVTFESSEWFDQAEARYQSKSWFERLLTGFQSPVQTDEFGNRFISIPDATDNGTGGGMIIEMKKQGEEIGNALVDGVVGAIDERQDEGYEKGQSIVGSIDGANREGIVGGMADAGDIHSPSGLTEEVGIDLIDGLFLGLDTMDAKMNDFLSRFSEKINRMVEIASTGASNLQLAFSSVNFGGVSTLYGRSIPIPKMASGGVIPPNREFLAVFGDQRSGNNIETPEALMRQIVREETGNGNSRRLETLMEELISIVSGINIGDEVIGRANARYNRRHGRSIGG